MISPNIDLFADDCSIFRETINDDDINALQSDLLEYM